MSATARDRAEDLLHTFQKRARELLDAEEGLAKSAQSLIQDHGLAPTEVRKRLEELVGRIKANKIWSKLSARDAVVALGDYRDGVERYAEESLSRLIKSLPLATKADVRAVQKELHNVQRALAELTQKSQQRAAGSSASTSSSSAAGTGSKRGQSSARGGSSQAGTSSHKGRA